MQPIDAQVAEKLPLESHHVAQRDERKVEGVRLTGCGIRRGWAGRAVAAAEHVAADDEPAIGVDRLAGPDHLLPPAGLVFGIVACRVGARGQSGGQQYGVVAAGIAPGLIGRDWTLDPTPRLELERSREGPCPAMRLVHGRAT
jgi:hypothetical protein